MDFGEGLFIGTLFSDRRPSTTYVSSYENESFDPDSFGAIGSISFIVAFIAGAIV
jgi:hypothetical protein